MSASRRIRLCDIGANLTDSMFQGTYHGKKYHKPDLSAVLSRAWDSGVERIIVTATNLQEAREALQLARTDERLFCTVGVHPTRCSEFEDYPGGAVEYMAALKEVISKGKSCGKVVAIGELGLDYDRLQFCDKDVQLKWLRKQLEMARGQRLPLFLHMRAAAADLLAVLRSHADSFDSGVVHSFDGTLQEAQDVLQIPGLRIGINGCSLKTAENLEVLRQLPLDRLLLETDSPWCEPRPSHASAPFVKSTTAAVDKKKYVADKHVKGRNEPGSGMIKMLEAVAGIMQHDTTVVAEAAWQNSLNLFFDGQSAAAQTDEPSFRS